jgi:hypothetical protein
MADSRFAVLIIIGYLGWTTLQSGPLQAQTGDDKKHAEAIRRTQRLLDERLVDTEDFQADMPLEKFLQALEKQLPRFKKMALGIDPEAFGERRAEVAATPIRLPAFPRKVTLRQVMEVVATATKIQTDYRLETWEAVITTPQRALYTVSHDIRELLAKPDVWARDAPALAKAEPIVKEGQFLEALFATVDAHGSRLAKLGGEGESIQLLNGSHLILRTNASRHVQVAEMLQVFRRLGDLAVFTSTRLFEVDAAFYKKLQSAKRVSLEELERQFLQGKAEEGESLFKVLKKQQMILAGEEIKVDNGQETALLSRHQGVSILPGPDRVKDGGKSRQMVLDGISVLGSVRVSADRRWVRVKLTEKATEIEEIRKSKAWDGKSWELDAEAAFLKETTHARVVEIPDGGSVLVPVQFRPASAQAKDRWWVLSVSVRIVIEEEERAEWIGWLRANLPRWLADAITNKD